ncbi:tyrosine-type recombinase/integrase [Paenibacillus sp. y28]|uniref:tyrosine-type recombinase/integrase n=1 Tax=Paenibacillus sp. y28 TaxID=3129110 RepID=UPI003017A6E7
MRTKPDAETRHLVSEVYQEELELFLISMKTSGMTASTQQAYLDEAKGFLATIHPKPIGAVKKPDILKHIALLMQRGVGDGARNRALAGIRAFFRALIDMQLVQANPALEVNKAKEEKNRTPVYLEERQLETYLREMEGKYYCRNLVILMLMAYAGLRVGEVHRLNIGDVQANRNLHVLGKGRKWRVIPLQESLYDLISEVIRQRIEPRSGNEQALFVSQFGRRISRRMIQHIAESTFEKMKHSRPELAGLKFSSHKLRHSFGTNQIRSGTDIRTLQELLGHQSIETTQIYTHVANQQLVEAMGKVKIPKLM